MSAPYYHLLSKTDRAIAAYVIAEGASNASNVLPFKYGQLKDPPVILAHSQSAAEDPSGSGIWTVQSSISIRTLAADETKDTATLIRESDALIGNVFDLFRAGGGDAVGAAITAAARALAVADPTNNADLADFTCQNVDTKSLSAGAIEDTILWEDTLGLELICCPSDVS